MRVWLDQYLCTGCSLCEVIAPSVFVLLDDGQAYVKDELGVKDDPARHEGIAMVAPDDQKAVLGASRECPGQCINVVED